LATPSRRGLRSSDRIPHSSRRHFGVGRSSGTGADTERERARPHRGLATVDRAAVFNPLIRHAPDRIAGVRRNTIIEALMRSDAEWAAEAKRVLRAEMVRRGITYDELSKSLQRLVSSSPPKPQDDHKPRPVSRHVASSVLNRNGMSVA